MIYKSAFSEVFCSLGRLARQKMSKIGLAPLELTGPGFLESFCSTSMSLQLWHPNLLHLNIQILKPLIINGKKKINKATVWFFNEKISSQNRNGRRYCCAEKKGVTSRHYLGPSTMTIRLPSILADCSTEAASAVS